MMGQDPNHHLTQHQSDTLDMKERTYQAYLFIDIFSTTYVNKSERIFSSDIMFYTGF